MPDLKRIAKTTLLVALTFAATGAVCVSPVLYLMTKSWYEDYSARRPFDATVWRDPAVLSDPDYPRLRMVDDLLQTHDFTEMTRQEALALLGPPSEPGWSKHALIYWLGPERVVMSIDSEWLAFELDAAGRVARHEIVRD